MANYARFLTLSSPHSGLEVRYSLLSSGRGWGILDQLRRSCPVRAVCKYKNLIYIHTCLDVCYHLPAKRWKRLGNVGLARNEHAQLKFHNMLSSFYFDNIIYPFCLPHTSFKVTNFLLALRCEGCWIDEVRTCCPHFTFENDRIINPFTRGVYRTMGTSWLIMRSGQKCA